MATSLNAPPKSEDSGEQLMFLLQKFGFAAIQSEKQSEPHYPSALCKPSNQLCEKELAVLLKLHSRVNVIDLFRESKRQGRIHEVCKASSIFF